MSKLPDLLEVAYWSIRGLGAPCRMMVMAAGVPLKATCYDLKEKKEGKGWECPAYFGERDALRERNPLVNLPYVVAENGKIIAQTNAVMHYIGRRCNMLGDSDDELIQCEELLCEVMDSRNSMVQFCYGSSSGIEETKEKGAALLKKQFSAGGNFWKLEQCLKKKSEGSTDFFVGTRLSAPDFHIWELLDQYILLAAFCGVDSPVKEFPLLEAFHKKFVTLPENKKYFDSPLSKLPINQKMGKFGADPKTNGPWVSGQEYDFMKYETTTF